MGVFCGVEQAEFHFRRMVRENRDVYAGTIPGGPQRIGLSGPDSHYETPCGKCDCRRRTFHAPVTASVIRPSFLIIVRDQELVAPLPISFCELIFRQSEKTPKTGQVLDNSEVPLDRSALCEMRQPTGLFYQVIRMKCPRCKCDDVYASRSGNEVQGIIAFLKTTVRCHRCCYLFSVPRWTTVPQKPTDKNNERRAA